MDNGTRPDFKSDQFQVLHGPSHQGEDTFCQQVRTPCPGLLGHACCQTPPAKELRMVLAAKWGGGGENPQPGSARFLDSSQLHAAEFPIFLSDPRQETYRTDKLHRLIKHPSYTCFLDTSHGLFKKTSWGGDWTEDGLRPHRRSLQTERQLRGRVTLSPRRWSRSRRAQWLRSFSVLAYPAGLLQG